MKRGDSNQGIAKPWYSSFSSAMSELSTPTSSSFNDRLARFKHLEAPATRKSLRLAGRDDSLPTPISTPSPLRKGEVSSQSTSNGKRSKPDTDSSAPSTSRKRQAMPASRSSQSPRLPALLKRKHSGYAPPSLYAHLSPIPDVLQPNLLVVFVGLNPGISTAKAGHAYSHPSNRFWHLLHLGGLTPERKLSPTEDRDLPRLYGYGHTNIVSRPTPDQGGLKPAELVAGTADLETKFRKWRPEALCIAGKGIWEAIWKYKHGSALSREAFEWGWQDESENMGCSSEPELDRKGRPWKGARVFVTTSPSGQAASVPWAAKVKLWTELGDWVKKRRVEMAETDAEVLEEDREEEMKQTVEKEPAT